MKGEDPNNINFSTNLLGEKSFNVFWASDGLKALMEMRKTPEMLDDVEIINAKGNKLTIEEFLDLLKILEVRVN